MKRVGKAWFFVFVFIIAFLTYTTFFGISTQYGDTRTVIIKGALNEGYENDGIRWGTDIRGGVDVTFRNEETEEGSGVYVDATDEEIKAAANVIENRLVLNNITDYEVYTDVENDRIIVRYPWKEGEDVYKRQILSEASSKSYKIFATGLPVLTLYVADFVIPLFVTSTAIVAEVSSVFA